MGAEVRLGLGSQDVEVAVAGMEIVEEDSFPGGEEGRDEEGNLVMGAFQGILAAGIRRGSRMVAGEVEVGEDADAGAAVEVEAAAPGAP